MKIPTVASSGVFVIGIGIFKVYWVTSRQLIRDAKMGGVSTQ